MVAVFSAAAPSAGVGVVMVVVFWMASLLLLDNLVTVHAGCVV